MNESAFWLGAMAAGFVLGSVPCALMLGKAKGVDIRTIGSKNVGATNLGRALGFRWFLVCFALDMVKGLVPTLGAGVIAGVAGGGALSSSTSWWWLGVMVSCVLGHMFSPFVGFKGGKGVATGLGAMLGVFPLLTLAGAGAAGVFAIVFLGWRYVSLASCAAAASLPAWTLLALMLREADPVGSGWPFLVVTAGVGALVVVKHRGNLRRLAAGTEPKVPKRAGSSPA